MISVRVVRRHQHNRLNAEEGLPLGLVTENPFEIGYRRIAGQVKVDRIPPAGRWPQVDERVDEHRRLAAGRNPAETLRTVLEAPRHRTLSDWANAWHVSRIDLDPTSRRSYKAHLTAILSAKLSDRDVTSLRESDVREWVAEQAERRLSASSIGSYMTTFRQILDFAEVQPNPARSKRVKLPKAEREEPNPPPSEHLTAILERVPPLTGLFLVTLEQGCLRIGETLSLRVGRRRRHGAPGSGCGPARRSPVARAGSTCRRG